MSDFAAQQSNILPQYRRRVDKEEYTLIRRLWKDHSIAEDNRDIPKLLETLSSDCAYELPQMGVAWRGLAGAEKFYNYLFEAFPDIEFDLRNIVIGPQGVYQEACVTATHLGEWFELTPTKRAVDFTILVLFPWNHEEQKFMGERIYFFNLLEQLAAS